MDKFSNIQELTFSNIIYELHFIRDIRLYWFERIINIKNLFKLKRLTFHAKKW